MAITWFSKLHFKNSKNFDGLHLVEMHKKEIKYDKPIYVGCAILDLSKLCMMDFHYNVIHKAFEGKYRLLYSDTDSLVYLLLHNDIYEWIKNNKKHFDLSESLRPDLRDNEFMKTLGKFKDEFYSLIIKEWLALNPKVYSINHQTLNEQKEIIENNKKVCKGIKAVVLKN